MVLGDNIIFDWYYNNCMIVDDVIDFSYYGFVFVYFIFDLLIENFFVKIWEKGLYEFGFIFFFLGKWVMIWDIKVNNGFMNFCILVNLKVGL